MLKYTIEKHANGAQVVTFSGRVTFGRQTEQCRGTVKELVAAGERRFVFDLTGVEYVDSAGIGFLVSCLTTLGQAGAKLRLASTPDRVRHVLEITRLDTVFEICKNRDAALGDFKDPRSP
jgi:anti-sigma B factor antagonist